MADPCPTCRRPMATRQTELEPGVCTKRLGDEQWRRTECCNVGVGARDTDIARLEATIRAQDELLGRAREVLVDVAKRLNDTLDGLPEEVRGG